MVGSVPGQLGRQANKWHLANHIVSDVIMQNPCHIVVAQEVDEETQQVMREVINTESRPPLYAPATGACFFFRARECGAAHVGDGLRRREGKTNMVAARSTHVASVELLEWHKTCDGEYKAKKKQ